MKKFAERLRDTLIGLGISQSEFARRMGMSQSIMNNYCTGRREPSLDVLVKISKELGESTDYLLGLED